MASGAVWLCPSAGPGSHPGEQPCCSGSHWDIADRQTLLQRMADIWGLLQARGRSCRMCVQEQGGGRVQTGCSA